MGIGEDLEIGHGSMLQIKGRIRCTRAKCVKGVSVRLGQGRKSQLGVS